MMLNNVFKQKKKKNRHPTITLKTLGKHLRKNKTQQTKKLSMFAERPHKITPKRRPKRPQNMHISLKEQINIWEPSYQGFGSVHPA